MENPKNQNNSFSRNHTIGTRNINIKTIKNIFINLPITIFSFKFILYLLFFYNAKIQPFFHTAKYLKLKNVKYKNFFDNTTQSKTPYFSRQFNFIEIIFDITKKQKFFRPPKFPVLIDVKAFFNLIDIKFHIATTRNFFKLTKNFQC